MILERVTVTITPGSELEFEAAIEEGKELISQARGFRSLKLLRGIEQPSSYLLLVEWDTIEDHLVGFRESELFTRWRELTRPHFAAPAAMEHFEAPVVTR